MNCPSEITLIDYLEGKLSPGEKKKIDAHVCDCRDCLEALAQVQRMPGNEELEKIKVPKEWIERAKRIPEKFGNK